MTNPAERRPATRAVRAGICEDQAHGAVMPPLYLSSNYTFAGFDQKREYDYSRSGNPTRDQLGTALAQLEHGAGATVTGSGMAAIHLVLAALVEPGQLVVAPHDCYGGTYRLLDSLAQRGAFDVTFVDQSDARAVEAALARRPRLVMLETPSNPLLRIVDIEALATRAHAAGALVVADNTFLSPALQTPLRLGADIVVHSTTKYLNGHSDVVGGAAVAATPELHEALAWWANCLGLTGAAFDSFLTLRGLRTLGARMRVHEENAGTLAHHLDAHPAVTRVYYPGLEHHRGHALARRQQSGFGGMLSFELAGGEAEVRAFLSGLDCFALAESLGGVESLIAHPATMTHAAMAPQARRAAGIGDTLLRLSAGIEDVSDLVADIDAGLARARRGRPTPVVAAPVPAPPAPSASAVC